MSQGLYNRRADTHDVIVSLIENSFLEELKTLISRRWFTMASTHSSLGGQLLVHLRDFISTYLTD
jgi:hypothetical protein